MGKTVLDKGSLRRFGVTMGIAFLVITLLMFIRHRHSVIPTSIISALFFVVSLTIPGVLKPVYIFWMKLAFILGWINTRLILLVIFYLVFTPIGLAVKLLRIDLLDLRIDKRKVSYWKDKGKKLFNPLDYERQF